MKKAFIFFFLTVIIWSCTQKTNLEYALMQAGDNRAELEKVLRHYANDSLKYAAVCFLIENMPYHYCYTGEEVEYDKRYFKMLAETALTPEDIADSLKRGKMFMDFDEEELKYDIQEVDSAYLVNNVDWAFKVWREQPWGARVGFEDFCEYILPYRVGDESLTEWREVIYNKFNPLLDSIRGKSEGAYPWVVAEALLDSLKKRPIRFTSYPYAKHSVGPQVVDWLSGNCLELTDALTYIYRALGIPAGCDVMLMRGDNNVAHYWNFVQDKYCDAFYCSPLYPALLEQAHTYYTPKGKVYRKTFSLNREMMEQMNERPENIHPIFRFPLMRDVTDIYTDSEQTINISESRLYEKPKKNEIVYLCLSSKMAWVPVAWSYCKKQQVSFDNVDGNVVFRLAVYRDKHLIPLSDPFWVNKELDYFRFFGSQDAAESVTLLHKFNLFIEPFIERMVGGVFEGSNDADFSQKDTLFIVRDKPVRLRNVVSLGETKKYRYLRYCGPPGGYCNVSEVEFYKGKNDTIPLKGKIIGTPGINSDDKSHWYTNVFDGDPYTSFDYHLPDSGWAGIDLGIPVAIEKIIFTPRNRDNFIRAGDKYELFYDKKGVWTSAGRVIAKSDSLVYNVPKGALLYLRNYTRGMDERIFEYYDGGQVFW